MDNNSNVEQAIKLALLSKADKTNVPEELFANIQNSLDTCDTEARNGFKRMILSTVFRRTAAVICGTLILINAFFICSKDARVMAIEAINKVKTIFVVEKVGDNVTIVERPATEANLTNSVSTGTQLSDAEISKKVGYKVTFPESLIEKYSLSDKVMGVVLGKQTSYVQFEELQSSMLTAIDDDLELEKLKEYQAMRHIFAGYKNEDGDLVVIYTSPAVLDKELDYDNTNATKEKIKKYAVEVQPVKIKEFNGFWIEHQRLEYPMENTNGIGGSDLTQKPIIVGTKHSLRWKANDLVYCINTYQDYEISLDEALQIAEAFMENQK